MSGHELDLLNVSPSVMKRMVGDCLFAKITPMVWGPPGIGKSEIMAQIAKEYNLKLIDVRLTTFDITDLNGFPDNKGEKATYKVFDTFPVEGDPLPLNKDGAEYDGWLVFLDELPSVSPAMQASAYKLILDRMVGNHRLHKNCALAAAGNDVNHGAISSGMGTAAGTRMCHINLLPSLEDWVEHATGRKVDHRIVSFVQYKPELFHAFTKKSDDKTHPTPRTWVHTSKLVKNTTVLDHDYHLPLVAGNVGRGAAAEFITYCQIYDDLVKFSDIIRSPASCKIPLEAANVFALTGVIIENSTEANIDKVLMYVRRLAFEFQVIIMRGLMTNTPALTENDDFSEWMAEIIVDMT